ncbi:hypothetical protein TREMEDRAFT_71463 [Tremella mesenterica DSM 1558]|uniref:uncharacterized protein n=1 Tax=Tremella mesenterica (strain ATCC 24925 / CBS 8224 / DSM 1558 / NBRC 9311 / NRRL Y-6157 / RJB 2259-6 / UBC 559-6) TaxID=578456 RepID=UPI0003F4A65D|nr:uncharacterized protein TREMEDRAFT_71463 [Tremella mesenterica DSM 1558]EIW69943.1 hypothetical protein TREMEDRAFT_71463 [Tremella mesenterica DSM 1558]
MDSYTTSFVILRSGQSHNNIIPLSRSLSQSISLAPETLSHPPSLSASQSSTRDSSNTNPSIISSSNAQEEKDWKLVQTLSREIGNREGCTITVTKEFIQERLGSTYSLDLLDSNISNAPLCTAYNVVLSGPQPSVLAARGALLRQCPRDDRAALSVTRVDFLIDPLASSSHVKAPVEKKLREIVNLSGAHISIVNSQERIDAGVEVEVLLSLAPLFHKEQRSPDVDSRHSSTAQSIPLSNENGNSADSVPSKPKTVSDGKETVTFGLESERMCDVIITGNMENVEVAKVRILVLQDELSGMHVESCDIDYKLHGIVSGRKRSTIQAIQENTGTNIYFPTKLVGVLNSPSSSPPPDSAYRPINMSAQPNAMHPMAFQMNNLYNMPTGMSNMPLSAHMGNGHSHQLPSPHGMNDVNSHPNGMTPSPVFGSGFGGPGIGPPFHFTGPISYHPPHTPTHRRDDNGPTYNPHQHVHYPYQPHPVDMNPQTPRGIPYPGHAMHQYPPPMGMNHTGIPNMPSPSYHDRLSPMPMNMGHQQHQNHHPGSSHPLPHFPHDPHHLHAPHPYQHSLSPGVHEVGLPMGNQPGGMSMSHQVNNMHMGHPSNGMHMSHQATGMRMGMNGNTPFQHPGPSHMHVGLGATHTGMNGMPMHMTGVHAGTGVRPSHFGAGPHPGLSIHGVEQGVLGLANRILITGEFFNVQRAKDMLLQAAAQKSHLVISRDTVILPRKLDWLLIERVDELRKIMSDNGTYIQVPSVGTQRSLITVFGDHRNSIERTIRCLMAMTCQYYLASVWLLPVSYDFITSLQPINALQMQPVLKNISQVTGAEVVFKNHCFEIYGLEYQVRSAVLMVLDLDVVKIFQCELRFQIELSVEHRDFLAGKKNGKINKIMKSANVKIRFETCNDYNFLIDITGGVPGALQGLSLLQMELPAEMSFYIPEKHHKRIIGAGGKNIQQIMRTYGVYVKFSNNEEFNSLGGYVDNEDNVIARTPAKNAAQLNNLMGAITRFIIPKSEKDFISDSLIIPRKYHRALLGEKNIFLHDIEAKTNTHIEFPAKETGSDMVNIFGPESQIHIAAAMLLDHVPFEINLHVPPNPAFIPLIRGEKFTEFTSTIQRDHHILISASPLFSETDAIFKFQCLRSNIEFLPAARDSLEEFLSGHGIQVYPTPALRRADSFTDASFSQLNARLLARANSRSDLDLDDSEILMNRHHRVGSNADVRALFDGTNSTGVNSSGATGLVPTQVLIHPSQSHGHGTRFVSMDNTGNSGFVGAFSIPQRATEYWQPSSNPMKNPSQSDPSKRDSDPIIQDRLSQLTIHPTRHPGTAPRAASHRTQSLDITSLNFVRLQRVPLGDSTVQGGGPNTSTGQFFPLPSHQAMHGHGLNGFSVDAGLGDVSQAMASIKVSEH